MTGALTRSIVLVSAWTVAWSSSAIAAPADAPNEPARMAMTVEGPVLFTPAGMALYVHTGENTKAPKFAWQCTDVPDRMTDDQQSGIGPRPNIGFKLIKSCLAKFPPYVAGADAQPTGEFGVVKRPDGTSQWTYRNLPLYLSVKDRRAGELNGVAGGLFGGGRRTGIRPAMTDLEIPAGLKLMRRAEGLVLVSADTERAVYTNRDAARFVRASFGREDFTPITAPALAHVSGDWSVVETQPGLRQFAYKGKPLFTAAASLNEIEISQANGWQPVVVVKAPPLPAAISTRLSLAGDVFTTRTGMSLYTYSCNVGGLFGRLACDDRGDPAAFMVALCGDGQECARRWRPYLAPPGAKPEGEFSIVDITYPMFKDMRGELYPADAPRVKAWAYRGKPLFTYYEDEKPGDIWGDQVGGIWGSMFNALQVPGKSATFFEP